MAGLIAGVIGSAVALFGFVAMRDPMRFALLTPGQKGYYQRLVLDRYQRVQLRMLGVLLCLFGLVIATAALSGLPQLKIFESVSTALLVLLWLVFCGAWVFGLFYSIVLLIRGEFLKWLRLWRESAQLGPLNVYPTITPAMRKEAATFTTAFIILVGVAVIAALSQR